MNDFKDNTRNDDISQLFRQNAEQLEERPSIQTWDRLERKLETRRLRTRTIMYRYTSLAAAVIGVFALIMAVQLVNRVESGFENADNIATDGAVEQPLTEDELKIAQAIKEHQLEQEQAANELDESNDVITNPTEKTIQFNAKTDDESKKLNDANAKTQPSAPKPLKPTDAKPKVIVSPKNDKSDYSPPIAKVEVEDNKLLIEEEAEEEADIDMAADDEVVVKDLETAKDRRKAKAEAKPSDEPVIVSRDKLDKATENDNVRNQAGKIADESAGEEIAVRSKSRKEAAKKSKYKAQQLSNFRWLAGKWADGDLMISYENWYYSPQKGMIGEGYVMENGEKKFVEYMRIYEKKGKTYFESSIDNSKKFKTFTLISNKKGKAVFERKGKKFPNQVIIQKFDSKTFTIIYKNKKATSIKKSQSQYFQKRNAISSERVARKLRRQ